MPLTYTSGDAVQPGDRVRLGDEPGVVKLVVDAATGDGVIDWFLAELGPGVLVRQPEVLAWVYVSPAASWHRLHLVERGT